MDELDQLKSHWKKNEETYPKVSESDIYAMLHKRSSSIVKWILIISVIELAFWALGPLFSSLMGDTEGMVLPKFISVLDYINYAVLILFVTLFYINYKKISTEKPVKDLLKNIITIRRIVRFYMVYIISVVAFVLTFAIILFDRDYNNGQHDSVSLAVSIFIVVVMLIIAVLIYNVLYGRLLRKLNKNYRELKKMQQK